MKPIIKTLEATDIELSQSVFAVMASVFEEPRQSTSRKYVADLLSRSDLFVVAALVDGKPIAGLTAFKLPLTRSETAEMFVYDVAVLPAYQQHGIGRRLMQEVRSLAAAQAIATTWVPAEDEDVHALDFYRAIGGKPSPVTIFTFENYHE
ncbi:MAG: GNAT family N-acetyltransferase [Pseudomonadota bacterium]